MTVDIHFYTGRKGSNPGGKAIVRVGNREFHAYLKYCHSSSFANGVSVTGDELPFDHIEQPIYEAITLHLAQRAGLHAPNFYVLVNDGSLKVSYDSRDIPRINERMPLYFVSEIMEVPPVQDSEGRQRALERDKLYRDLLLVSDVSNKAQNFRYVAETGNILYLDLGCSFVNAVDGTLRRSNFKVPRATKNNVKIAERLLGKLYLETADGKDLLALDDLIKVTAEMPLPALGDRKSLRIGTFLDQAVLDEIALMLQLNIIDVYKDYREDSRLMRE